MTHAAILTADEGVIVGSVGRLEAAVVAARPDLVGVVVDAVRREGRTLLLMCRHPALPAVGECEVRARLPLHPAAGDRS